MTPETHDDQLTLFNEAAQSYNSKNYSDAAEKFRNYLDLYPSNDDRIFLWSALFGAQEYDQLIDDAINYYSNNQESSLYIYKSIEFCSYEHLVRQREWFEKTYASNPMDLAVIAGLARLHRQEDRHPDPILADRVQLFTPPNGERWWTPPLKNPADIVAAAMMVGRPFEPAVEAAAAQFVRGGDLVLDGGANFGQTAVAFARAVGQNGAVIAVEADPFVARVLAANITENQLPWIQPVQAALWDLDGETLFFETKDLTTSDSWGSRCLDPNPRVNTEDAPPILTRRIDSLLAELAPDRPLALIKLDVQGAEERSLLGAEQSLRRWRPPVIIEFDDNCLAKFGSRRETLIAIVKDWGYADPLQIDQMNWLFTAAEC